MKTDVKTDTKADDLALLPSGARVVALIVGLENYRPSQTHQIQSVPFAKADAEAIKSTFEKSFYNHRPEIITLTDSDATHSSLINEIKSRTWGLGEDDLFIFYYAGHGFHDQTGNRLTVWDTNVTNIGDTTLSVENDLLAPLRRSPCQRVLAFIDACATQLDSPARTVITPLDTEAFVRLLQTATFSAVFLSCRAGEQSFPDSDLKHGIWTYYLVKALSGHAGEAIDAAGFITGASLQDYLRQEVPRHVSQHPGISGTQTPQYHISANGTFALRHIGDTLNLALSTTPPTPTVEGASDTSPDPYPGSSTALFHDRFASAFPGVRSPRWFTESADIQRRLARLMAKPLKFSNGVPFWWWGHGNMHITRFDHVSDRLYLMNHEELDILKIAAAPGDTYWSDFVYVEVAPMAPTGVNENTTPEDIARRASRRGYDYEPYGLFDGHIPITRDEFDDGGAEICGELVDTIGRSEARTRYLTRYNFLIASVGSPINNPSFDSTLRSMLLAVLEDEKALVNLVDVVARLPRQRNEP